jgi:hypothetical protein
VATNDDTKSIWTQALPASEYLKVGQGEEVRGVKILALDIRPSKFLDHKGNPKDEYVAEIEVEGRPEKNWSINVGATKALDAAHVKIGDTIDLIRGRDRPIGEGRNESQWTITVRGGPFDQPKPVADAMAPTGGQSGGAAPSDDDIPY